MKSNAANIDVDAYLADIKRNRDTREGKPKPALVGDDDAPDDDQQIILVSAEKEPKPDPWPVMADDAFIGPSGRAVRTIEPHSETDPVALLLQYLTAFGNAAGNTAYFPVESDKHTAGLYLAVVGQSSKARKPAPNYSRLSRYDCTGLLWLLHGNPVVALTDTTAAIRSRTGEITTYRKFKSRRSGRSAIHWRTSHNAREV